MSRDFIDRRQALRLCGATVASPFVLRAAWASDPIKLGSLLDGTGPIGIEGRRMIQTTKYAIDELNAAGATDAASVAKVQALRAKLAASDEAHKAQAELDAIDRSAAWRASTRPTTLP